MKIISFCLWGDNPKYTIGAVKNAILAKTIYPDWICRFYCGQSVPSNIIEELKSFDNTEIIIMDEPGDWKGMFWRFYPASEENIEAMLSRDTDSRLSNREKVAVDYWLKSDKGFLSLRDHPYHNIPILGGMWGVKKGVVPDMKTLIDKFVKGDFWQVDQNFLTQLIWSKVKDNCMIFDEYYGGFKYPTKRVDYEFIGDVFDENDVRHPDYWKIIQKFESR